MIEIVSSAVFIAFLICMSFLPQGIWQIGRFRRPDDFAADASNLRDRLSAIRKQQAGSEVAEIEKILSRMLDDPAMRDAKSYDYFTQKISASIEYSIKRHDWYEDQRARLFQASLTLMTGVLAVVAIALRAASTVTASQEKALIVLGLITVGSVLRVILLYNRELDADRPYRLIADIRLWFFRYNLPGVGGKRTTKRNALSSAEDVASERKRFMSRVLENTDLALSIREDLEQIFTLQVLQRYKSESLTRIRWALSYFLMFASIQLLVFSVLPRILNAF
jgi:hypothetical protein